MPSEWRLAPLRRLEKSIDRPLLAGSWLAYSSYVRPLRVVPAARRFNASSAWISRTWARAGSASSIPMSRMPMPQTNGVGQAIGQRPSWEIYRRLGRPCRTRRRPSDQRPRWNADAVTCGYPEPVGVSGRAERLLYFALVRDRGRSRPSAEVTIVLAKLAHWRSLDLRQASTHDSTPLGGRARLPAADTPLPARCQGVIPGNRWRSRHYRPNQVISFVERCGHQQEVVLVPEGDGWSSEIPVLGMARQLLCV